MSSKIKVAIADDHSLLRKSLAQLLEDDIFIVKVQADNGQELIDQLPENTDVQVVLMDINMPVMNGFKATEYLRKHHPQIKIIVLTMSDSDKDIVRMITTGAHGYLLKDTEPIVLKRTIRDVVQNGALYNEFVTSKMANKITESEEIKKVRSIISQLTVPEIEYIKLACKDLTHREIAIAMELSPRTIDGYRDTIYSKLEIQSRVALVIFALKHGIFSID